MLKAVTSPGLGLIRKQYSPSEYAKNTFQLKTATNLELIKALANAPRKKVVSKKVSVTRKDYPKIVRLKLAGNSDKIIAKKMGVKAEQLKPHVTKALFDYRNGEVDPDAGETVKEARKVGAEKALKTVSGIAGGSTYSAGAASVATSSSSSNGGNSGGVVGALNVVG